MYFAFRAGYKSISQIEADVSYSDSGSFPHIWVAHSDSYL